MAKKLYITTQSGGYTYQNYNFLTGTLTLVEGSRKRIQSGNRIVEVMQLISASGSTDTAIIAAENKLTELGHMARDYIQDPLQKYPVWFQENATSETMRQSLVFDIRIEQREESNTSMLLGRQGISIFNVAIERADWWEPETVISQTAASGVASCGGTAFIEVGSAYNAGVIDGRMVAAIIVPSNTSAREIWMGVRKSREAYDLSTQPIKNVWQLKLGTAGTDTALANEGTNAYSGTTNNILSCTFATTATMATRATIDLGDVTGSDVEFWPGKYLVLLRAKVGSSTSCRVRLSTGYGTNLRVHNDVDISNTSYKLIPLGEVSAPSSGYRLANTSYYLDSNSLWNMDWIISAERLSGTGYLYLDALVFIPADALFYAHIGTLASNDRVVVYTFPDGTMQALVADSSLHMKDGGEFVIQDWRMPYMGPTEETMQNMIVFAFQTDTVQTVTDTLGYQVVHLPRFRSFGRYA